MIVAFQTSSGHHHHQAVPEPQKQEQCKQLLHSGMTTNTARIHPCLLPEFTTNEGLDFSDIERLALLDATPDLCDTASTTNGGSDEEPIMDIMDILQDNKNDPWIEDLLSEDIRTTTTATAQTRTINNNVYDDDTLRTMAATATAGTFDFQPTPIDESSLHVVREVPLISRSLFAEREALSDMLCPLKNYFDSRCDFPSTPIISGSPTSASASIFSTTPIPQRQNSSAVAMDTTSCQQQLHFNNSAAAICISNASSSSSSSTSSDASSCAGSSSDCEDHSSSPAHLRADQSDQWKDRYNELLAYKKQYNHCNVPYHWAPNLRLSQWVKRQRHQHKLKTQGKHSNMSDERQTLLDNLGFVWDSRASNWDNRLDELKDFQKQFGHIQVSAKNPKHRPLAVWLKRQRHNARRLRLGDQSTGMTEHQMQQLLDLGVKLNVHLAKGL